MHCAIGAEVRNPDVLLQMLFIQRHWRAAIRARKAKLNILYLQWVRYETNMLRERKRQDAEYELRLKREIMMVPAAKRKSVQMKGLPTRAESSSAKVKTPAPMPLCCNCNCDALISLMLGGMWRGRRAAPSTQHPAGARHCFRTKCISKSKTI